MTMIPGLIIHLSAPLLVIRIIRFHGLSRILSQLGEGAHFGLTYKIDNLPITHDTTLTAQGS